MMRFLILSLLFFLFRSVSALGNVVFSRIEVNIDQKTCNATHFNLSSVDTVGRGPLFDWLTDRKNKKETQCMVQPQLVRCYCDDVHGTCWDYGELMNAMYMLKRDLSTAKIPVETGKNDKRSLENIDCFLDALYDAIHLPYILYETVRQRNHSQLIAYALGPNSSFSKVTLPFQIDSNATYLKSIPRSYIKMHFNINPKEELIFYCRGAFCTGSQEMLYLMIKEKLLEQHSSNEILYQCSLSGSDCRLDNIKKQLPRYLDSLRSLQYVGLKEKRVMIDDVTLRKTWGAVKGPRHGQIVAVMYYWTMSVLLLSLVLLTIYYVLSCEFDEERKPLNASDYKLRDVEVMLIKKPFRKRKEKEQTTLSLQGKVQWEAAQKAEKKREEKEKEQQEHRKHRTTRSRVFSSPIQESDLGSVKKESGKKRRGKNGSGKKKSLQKTQNETDNRQSPQPPPLGGRQPSLQQTQNEGQIQRSRVVDGVASDDIKMIMYPPMTNNEERGSIEFLEYMKEKRKNPPETQVKKKKKGSASSHAVPSSAVKPRSNKASTPHKDVQKDKK